MKFQKLGSIAIAFACMGTVLPPASFAGTPIVPTTSATTTVASTPAAAAISDIALRTGGLLVGQVVDQQGVAKAGTPVSIQFAGKEVVSTTTDANGVFAAKGIRGGQYELVTHQGGSPCRLWAADTAPPSARPAALIVSGDNIARGQVACGEPVCENRRGPMHSWLGWAQAHPYVVAGTVAAAIAIPLAMAGDDFDSGS